MCVCTCTCVCVFPCMCGRWEGAHLANRPFSFFSPSVSQKAHLHFQLSDLLVSLSDIGAVKLSCGLHFMTHGMIIFLPYHRAASRLLFYLQFPAALSPLPILSLPLLENFFIWLEDVLVPRRAVRIPSSAGIRRKGDVDGCLLPSAGELSPRTTPTMTRSPWHALLQLPVSWHEPPAAIAGAGLPPGRMLRYAAVIHLLQLVLEMCHTHTPFPWHTQTSWISRCQEQQSGQASCAQSRCTRQEERNENRGEKKRQQVCVIPQTAEKYTPMSKSTFLPQAQWRDYSKLPGRQQDVSRQTPCSSLLRELIRFEAHPGTLSIAFECTCFSTLIPPKPLQLM